MTTIWLFMQAARILSALMVLINQTLKNTDYEHILDDKLDIAPPGVQFDGVDNTSDVAFGKFPRLERRYCSYLLPKQTGYDG